MRLIMSLICVIACGGCKSKAETMCRCKIQQDLKGTGAMMGGPTGQIYVNNKMKDCQNEYKSNLNAICELHKECC